MISRNTQYAPRNTQHIRKSSIMTQNIILTGFMGTGKTSVGPVVAARLGRRFVSLDDVIAERAAKPIPAIFAEDGEDAFRALEAAVCRELAAPQGLVVATGGGAAIDPANREALAAGGTVICLDAAPEVILRRVGDDAGRPMLAGGDRLARIRALLAQRADAYAAIPHHLDTGNLTIAAAAERVLGIVAGLPEGGHCLVIRDERRKTKNEGADSSSVIHRSSSVVRPSSGYAVLIAGGVLRQAGRHIVEAGLPPGRCAVITNPTVGQYHLETLRTSLVVAGFEPLVCEVPDGEQHKTLATMAGLYAQLTAAKLARNEPVIALGGGVVGDMAGFTAATWLRGVPFVQIPTSLLAMVDSSVGGKTGVDLPEGKNLVGAFKQPALVLIDPDLLATLPGVELRSGMAEIIKTAIIGDPELFDRLDTGIEALAGCSRCPEKPAEAPSPEKETQHATRNTQYASRPAGRHNTHHAKPPDMVSMIAAAVRVKADIVERDPFEAGDRAWLNLGHTFGHALELISGFTLRHGEGVGLGLVAAAELSASLGLCAIDLPEKIRSAVERHGLPVRYSFDPNAALAAMGTDKKRRGRSLRFVVIRDIGRVEMVDGVPEALVSDALGHIR